MHKEKKHARQTISIMISDIFLKSKEVTAEECKDYAVAIRELTKALQNLK